MDRRRFLLTSLTGALAVPLAPADSQGSALHDSNRPGWLPNSGVVVSGKVLVHKNEEDCKKR